MEHSQSLTTFARQVVLDDGRKNREVLEQNFNYPQTISGVESESGVLVQTKTNFWLAAAAAAAEEEEGQLAAATIFNHTRVWETVWSFIFILFFVIAFYFKL